MQKVKGERKNFLVILNFLITFARRYLITNFKTFCIMKKIILLLFIAAAIALSSCDDGKPHCWQVTLELKHEEFPPNFKLMNYLWKTADEIDVWCTNVKFMFESGGATDVKITKKKVKISEEDCKAMYKEW